MAKPVVFSPPPGTILGETDYSIPGRWCASSNVRYVNGKVQPIGGWTTLNASPGVTDYVVSMLEWISKDGTRRLALGATGSLSVLSGSSLSSAGVITPGGFSATTNNRWTFDLWGDHLICCLSGSGIYEYSLTPGSVPAVTNAPTVNTVALVTHTRQLMALGTKEELSGTFNPRCIRWTDTEDNTDWTTTPANLAGEYILDGSGGKIRCAKKIGTQIAVWTDDELFLGTYTFDPSKPWVFERQAIGCGCMGTEAATIADGVAYWISTDLRLMMWVPGSMPVAIPGVPTSYLTGGTFTTTGLPFAFTWHNRTFNEIWFHVTVTSSFPTNYISVAVPSIQSGSPVWAPGSLARTSMYQGPGGVYGFGLNSGKLVQHDTVKQGNATNDRLSWSAESLVYLDEGQNRVYVQGCTPDFETQTGNVTLTITTLDYPQGNETTPASMPKTIAAGDDRTDFRVSGKLFRIKLSGSDGSVGFTDTFVRMGKLTFPVVPGGGR